jgi:hypothetical protein
MDVFLEIYNGEYLILLLRDTGVSTDYRGIVHWKYLTTVGSTIVVLIRHER